MKNPLVLIEHVDLLRSVLAASEHAEVARAGRLGEITYLVDQLIEQRELEIYDALIASSNRPIGAQRLNEQRSALAPHVGKSLLKAGIQCESRQYEIYFDPSTHAIVNLSGFCLRPPPEPPGDALPAEQARWIFEHPSDGWRSDGQRVVERLLDGRDTAQLSTEELELLAKGYNWAGHHTRSFETARVGQAREPHSAKWLPMVRLYARNAFADLPRLLTACDASIAQGIGPAAFWLLIKADEYQAVATGERELEDFDWSPTDPILHPELLRPAAEALEAALAIHPDLREDEVARAWVFDWNERFAAVLQQPQFKHLARAAR